MIAAKCPDLNRLHDYLAGRLDDATAADLERHLGACPHCERTLCELEAEPDSLVGILRAGQPSVAAPLAPQVLSAQEFAASLPDRLRPVANLQLAPATMIGAYELIRLLGQGGMGAVYLARHRKLDKQVALKLLPPLAGHRQEEVARFQREIRATGKLDHAAIVRATDAGEVDGAHFLVMDAIDGLDVGKICKAAGPLAIVDACEIARQGAVGLAYAHSQGIVHRDVKPSNLMLDRRGQVKILDFGLAQMEVWTDDSAALTTAGQLMGTLDYMAPEQAEGDAAPDERADIYALGATLYRLLVNHPPLTAGQGVSPLEKLRLIATAEPAPIETLRADVPAELAQFVMRLLARDPAKRPQTAAEVAERLAPFCAGADLASLLAAAEGASRADGAPADAAEATSARSATTPPPAPIGASPGHVGKWFALAGLAAILAAAILLAWPTSPGELILQSPSADVQVRLLKDGALDRTLDVRHETRTIQLSEGAYEILLDPSSEALTLSVQRFVIRRGNRVIAAVTEKRPPTGADPPRPPSIQVAEVGRQSVVIEQQYVCLLDAEHVAEIRAPANGHLDRSPVNSGQRVKQGEVLFELTQYVDRQNGTPVESVPLSLTAPFDGLVSQVRSQGLVEQGETLATLIDDSVIRVNFNVPEVRAEQLQHEFARRDKPILELRLANGRTFDQVGKLVGIGPDVNPQTGNVTFRADFPNPQGTLRRGQTGVAVISESVPDAITVPQQATFEKLGKRYLFVVNRQNFAHQREIVVDYEFKDQFIIRSGVNANETIVVEGVRKVRDGERIE